MNNRACNLSVIIPCYNSEKYLSYTLICLENQTFKEFEVVIIDDGSTDNTKKIVEQYIRKGNLSINYYFQKNAGVSAARNKGIHVAKGKYIFFLDSDDILSQFALDQLYKYVKVKCIVFTPYTRNLSKCLNISEDEIKNNINIVSSSEVFNIFLHRVPTVNFFSILYEKSILDTYNIRFSEDLKYGEDNEFMWKYILHVNEGYFFIKPMYGYRVNSESAMAKKTMRVIDTQTAMERVITYSKNIDSRISEKLESFMLPRTKLAVSKEFCKQKDWHNFKAYSSGYSNLDYKNMKSNASNIKERVANTLLKKSKITYYILIRFYYRYIEMIIR